MTHLGNTIHHVENAICNMTNGSAFGSMAVGAGALFTSFIAPVQWLLVVCFALTVLDMIFGFRVARQFKQKIESGKNWKGTIRKIIDEFTIILAAHGIEWAILGEHDAFVLTGGVTAIIALTEFWSVIENLNTIDPKGPWRVLGKFLRKKGEDYTGIELNFNENERTDDNKVGDNQLENRS